jgi:hypothetical protein
MPHTQLGTVNRKAKNMSKIGNENWQLGKKTPIARVDELADSLAKEFTNQDYRMWYVVAIYDLGEQRILEIRARVSDAKFPGKLFTHYVNQERHALRNKWRLGQEKKLGNG